MSAFLENALALPGAPGTNRRDQASGASWAFLLPTLEVGRALCLGAPSVPSLAGLARLGRSVTVWCPAARQRARLQALVAERGWAHVELVGRLPAAATGEGNEAGFDLICLLDETAGTLKRGHRRSVVAAAGLLHRDGRAYVELSGPARRRLGQALLSALADRGMTAQERLWLPPRRGQVRAAVPAGAPELRAYLVGRNLHRPTAPAGHLDRLGRAVARATRQPPRGRAAVFAAGPGAAPVGAVPLFVADMAAAAGIELAGYRWALSAPGRFNSRKVVLLLFPPSGGQPEVVVKLTRDARLNPRLENEHRALVALDGLPGRCAPAPRFFGVEGGLAVLGQEALEGLPFERATLGGDRCPHAAAAMDGLLELAAATGHGPAPPGEVVAGLASLLERYASVYRPGADEHRYLQQQVAVLGAGPMPTPFSHGDPGTWNLLVRPDGTVAFLDWEAAERRGMPLWDLFHFFRSYAVLSARRSGTRDALDGFMQHVVRSSPLSQMMAASVIRHVDRLTLPPEMVRPLFLTGFMHRAVKEATRLEPARLGSGHYVRLLRACIAERDHPALRRLLEPAGPAKPATRASA